MDGHVIDALRRLFLDHFQHYFRVQILHALDTGDGFVDWHGADGHGRVTQDGFADVMDVTAGGEVHHSVGAVVHGGVQFLQFFLRVRGDGRIADIGVDLAQRGHADGHGLKFRMVDVGGNDHAAAGDFIAYEFWCDLFTVGYVAHFFCDDALAGVVHLGEVAVGVLLFACGQPLSARLGDGVSIAGIAIIGGHRSARFPCKIL